MQVYRSEFEGAVLGIRYGSTHLSPYGQKWVRDVSYKARTLVVYTKRAPGLPE
jgi:hypothetical protein